ncbi:hypothetical protein [Modestobacter sp. SSW1-42]|uniref:hypothetical protein n=1 Tax=Modestobacter sp. SSW1-42 TaxID=596372 RepID=UPI00398888FD
MPTDVAPDDALDRARRLLDPRLEPIREMATARANRNEARAAAARAETADARAYANCVKAGWTEAELRTVGFDAPTKRLPGRPATPRTGGQTAPEGGTDGADAGGSTGDPQDPA